MSKLPEQIVRALCVFASLNGPLRSHLFTCLMYEEKNMCIAIKHVQKMINSFGRPTQVPSDVERAPSTRAVFDCQGEDMAVYIVLPTSLPCDNCQKSSETCKAGTVRQCVFQETKRKKSGHFPLSVDLLGTSCQNEFDLGACTAAAVVAASVPVLVKHATVQNTVEGDQFVRHVEIVSIIVHMYKHTQ